MDAAYQVNRVCQGIKNFANVKLAYLLRGKYHDGMRTKLAFLRAASIASQIVGVFGFVEVRWMGAKVMVNGHPIDPFFIQAACIFLFTVGTVSIIGLCWNWISSRTDSQKFGNLYQEIVTRRDEIATIMDRKPSRGDSIIYVARLIELHSQLQILGIKTPNSTPRIDNLNSDQESDHKVIIDWCMFLMSMAKDSRAKDIKNARKWEEAGNEQTK